MDDSGSKKNSILMNGQALEQQKLLLSSPPLQHPIAVFMFSADEFPFVTFSLGYLSFLNESTLAAQRLAIDVGPARAACRRLFHSGTISRCDTCITIDLPLMEVD